MPLRVDTPIDIVTVPMGSIVLPDAERARFQVPAGVFETLDRPLQRGFGEDEQELLTSPPGHGVVGKAFHQALSHRFENPIADAVSESIVH